MSITVMKQALEAFELRRDDPFNFEVRPKRDAAIASLRQAIATEESSATQEPVAYIHRNEYNEYWLEPHDDFDIKSIPFNTDIPLYPQPKREPLTKKQIVEFFGVNDVDESFVEFVRTIEAAHGITASKAEDSAKGKA